MVSVECLVGIFCTVFRRACEEDILILVGQIPRFLSVGINVAICIIYLIFAKGSSGDF